MSTLKGIGAVWGVGGVTFSGVVISGSVAKQQSFSFERSASNAKLANESGDTVGESYYDQLHTVRASMIPVGAAISNARTSLDTCLPSPGTKITLVDTESTVSPANYVVDRATNSRTNTGFASIDLEMHKPGDTDIATTIT
jgi:hypothetical protein